MLIWVVFVHGLSSQGRTVVGVGVGIIRRRSFGKKTTFASCKRLLIACIPHRKSLCVSMNFGVVVAVVVGVAVVVFDGVADLGFCLTVLLKGVRLFFPPAPDILVRSKRFKWAWSK